MEAAAANNPLKKQRTSPFNYKDASFDVFRIFLGILLAGIGGALFFHIEGDHGDKKKRFAAFMEKVGENKSGLFLGKNEHATFTEKTAFGFLEFIKSSKDKPDDVKQMVGQVLSIEAALVLAQKEKQAQKEEEEKKQ